MTNRHVRAIVREVGDDDARARATLTEMQLRISQGPHAALGVAEAATAEQVRAAFLALTKQFHPARFGRLATDVQRLSNEVFLGIKAAHDQMLKQLGVGKRNMMQSGGIPVITDAKVSGAMPAVRAPTPGPARPGTPPLARGTDRMPERASTPAVSRTATPTPTPTPPAISRTATPTPPAVSRTATPSQPVISRTATPIQPMRASTPALGTPVSRGTTPGIRPPTPPAARAPSPPQRPPAPSAAISPDTVRGVAGPREATFDERAAVREALMLLNDQSWSEARQALSTLAAKVPQSKNYRALLGYARGREAQTAGRTDEAALEYQRALELDPQLAMAKQALAEVQRRR